jgi:lysylphosphatidylglycerol synthetase-like protein (DUF2156 family)
VAVQRRRLRGFEEKEVNDMKQTLRDTIGAVLVAAIAVPYAGYLVNGEMPFIQDPRGMSAVALVLGAAAYLVIGRPVTSHRLERVFVGVIAAVAVLGVVAFALAETAAAEALLAVFVVSVVVAFAALLVNHLTLGERSASRTRTS